VQRVAVSELEKYLHGCTGSEQPIDKTLVGTNGTFRCRRAVVVTFCTLPTEMDLESIHKERRTCERAWGEIEREKERENIA
jgi:hypothetical protein